MNTHEYESLVGRMKAADRRTRELLVQDMPRSGKGRDAFLALLHQQAVSHALLTALQNEMADYQLLRLAYLSNGDTVH